MSEATTILLLVVAELGLVVLVAAAVALALNRRRRRREQSAVDGLLQQVAEDHKTRQVALSGWLTRTFGYSDDEARGLADQLLAAETTLYRDTVSAIQARDPAAIAALPAAVDRLTYLYRDIPMGGAGASGDDIEYTPGDTDFTKLGEEPAATTEDAPADRPPAAAGGEDDELPEPEESGERDELPEPDAPGDGGELPADAGQTPPQQGDSGDEPAADVAEDEERNETAGEGRPVAGGDGSETGERKPEPAASGTAEAPANPGDELFSDSSQSEDYDPLDDFFDSPDEPDKEPPVHR